MTKFLMFGFNWVLRGSTEHGERPVWRTEHGLLLAAWRPPPADEISDCSRNIGIDLRQGKESLLLALTPLDLQPPAVPGCNSALRPRLLLHILLAVILNPQPATAQIQNIHHRSPARPASSPGPQATPSKSAEVLLQTGAY